MGSDLQRVGSYLEQWLLDEPQEETAQGNEAVLWSNKKTT